MLRLQIVQYQGRADDAGGKCSGRLDLMLIILITPMQVPGRRNSDGNVGLKKYCDVTIYIITIRVKIYR